MNMIEINGLHKSFGEVKAVQNIGFKVKEGELFAFLGVNGAGKSTISKTVAKELSYAYIDTGAMFRAVALFAIRNGADTEDGNESNLQIRHHGKRY